MYLIPLCLTLSNIKYVSRVKWSNPGKGVAPSPTPWFSNYWKGSLLIALDYGHQLYLLYIYIYIHTHKICHLITYKSWYAIKLNQATVYQWLVGDGFMPFQRALVQSETGTSVFPLQWWKQFFKILKTQEPNYNNDNYTYSNTWWYR